MHLSPFVATFANSDVVLVKHMLYIKFSLLEMFELGEQKRERTRERGGMSKNKKEVERKTEEKNPVSIASHRERERGSHKEDGKVTNVWP